MVKIIYKSIKIIFVPINLFYYFCNNYLFYPLKLFTMKKLLLIFLLMLAAAGFTKAQVVADYESGTSPFVMHSMANGHLDADTTNFGIVDNPDVSGNNTSTKVVKFTRAFDGNPWAGFWATLNDSIDVTTNKYLHVKVWKPRISPLHFKLQGGPNGDSEIPSMYAQTVVNGWEDIVFDFSAKTGKYKLIVFMPDFEDPVTLTEDFVMYFDDFILNNDPTPLGNNSQVTFNVDMHGSGLTSGQNVYLTGDFGGIYGIWNMPGSNSNNILTDTDNDSIYSITLTLDAAGTYQFKFFKGDGWEGGEWLGDPNRTITITGDTTANFVWGNLNGNSIFVPVVFTITDETQSESGIYVEGWYENFTGNHSFTSALDNLGNGIWSKTVMVEADITHTWSAYNFCGQNLSWKYSIGDYRNFVVDTSGNVTGETSMVLPQIYWLEAGNNGPVCEGNYIVLDFNINPWNYSSIQWTGPNGFSSNEYNPIVSLHATPAMSGTYYLVVNYSNGCTSGVLTDSTIVTVNPSAPPIAGNNGPICIGSTLQLTASDMPDATYTWYGPDGFTSTLQNPTVSNNATADMSGSYYVFANYNNGCVSQAGVTEVWVNPPLTTPEICMVSVDNVTSKNVVIWNKPQTTAIVNYNVYAESNQANIYNLIGTVPYASMSTFEDTTSNPIQQAYRYKISEVDTCGVETELSDYHQTIFLIICQGMNGSYNLLWTPYQGFEFPSYTIYRGTSAADLTLFATVSSSLNFYADLTPPSGTVYYQVEAVNPNPCTPAKSDMYNSSKSNIASNANTGIDENNLSGKISVYPNPISDIMNVEYTVDEPGKVSLSIFNTFGQLIATPFNGVQTTGKHKIAYDASTLPKGIYMLRYSYENRFYNVKLVKK
jgi:hypothetical protein